MKKSFIALCAFMFFLGSFTVVMADPPGGFPPIEVPQAVLDQLNQPGVNGYTGALPSVLPCFQLIDHYDVSANWQTGLVLNAVFSNNANAAGVFPFDNRANPSGQILELSFLPGEKKALSLTKFPVGSETVVTGADSGYLVILSQRALPGFTLFGQLGDDNRFDSLASRAIQIFQNANEATPCRF